MFKKIMNFTGMDELQMKIILILSFPVMANAFVEPQLTKYFVTAASPELISSIKTLAQFLSISMGLLLSSKQRIKDCAQYFIPLEIIGWLFYVVIAIMGPDMVVERFVLDTVLGCGIYAMTGAGINSYFFQIIKMEDIQAFGAKLQSGFGLAKLAGYTISIVIPLEGHIEIGLWFQAIVALVGAIASIRLRSELIAMIAKKKEEIK